MLPQANHAGERLHDAPADAHPPARQQHEHRQHEQHEHEHEQRGERGDCVKRGHSPHDGIRRRSAAVPAAAAATAAAAAGRRRAAALSGTIRRSTPFFGVSVAERKATKFNSNRNVDRLQGAYMFS